VYDSLVAVFPLSGSFFTVMLFRKNIIFVFVLLAMCSSCIVSRYGGSRDIGYSVAGNYFFSASSLPANPLIATRSEFSSLFGQAAFMGMKGKPTEIDFSRQFVICVVLPVTNVSTEVVPGRLTFSGNELTFRYTVKREGKPMSWTMRPMLLIVVDRKYLSDSCRLVEDR